MLKDLDEFLKRSSFKISYDLYHPSFGTVVAILRWLIQIIDPGIHILEIDSKSDRNEKLTFVKDIVTYWYTNHGVQLNPEKLYKGDRETLEESSKIINYFNQCDSSQYNFDHNRSLDTFCFSDLEDIKKDILQMLNEGSSLFKDIGLENHNFINLNNVLKKEINPGQFENAMKNMLGSLQDKIGKVEIALSNVRKEQTVLENKIGQRADEVSKLKARLESMVTLTPVHVEENEKCLEQIRGLNQIYVQNFRNLRYLEKRASANLSQDPQGP